MARFGDVERRAYERDGFVVLGDVIPRDTVRRLRRATDRLHAAAAGRVGRHAYGGAVFFTHRIEDGPRAGRVAVDRVCWAGAVEPALLETGRDPELLDAVAAILGVDQADHLINQVHFKLPGDGVAFPWHQDSTHRRYGTDEWTDVDGRGSFVQAVLAVDDVGPDNGPLRFLPGSHRAGHRELPRDGRLPSDLAAIDPVIATMPAGSLALFGPYVVHGSEPNRSDRPRRVLVNGFAVPGANRRAYPGRGAGMRISLVASRPAAHA